MIVHEPNIFVNRLNRRFEVPLESIDEYGFSGIVEFQNKVVISYARNRDKDDLRNVICFDRHTSEVLWQIEPAFEWPIRQKHYIEDTRAGAFNPLRAFVKNLQGMLWIDEFCYKHRPYNFSEEDGHFERHPDYQNRNLYKIINPETFLVREDTHELEPRVFFEDSFFNHGYCGRQFYTDMTSYDEDECLLVAKSHVYLYEVDIQTGKITPAYVRIEQTK